MDDKEQLRTDMKTKLKNISQTEKYEIESRLFDQLFLSDFWEDAKVIGITISQLFEWNTQPIIEEAWRVEKTVVVPKCYPKQKELKFYKFRSNNQLEVVYFNLLEPIPKASNLVDNDLIDLLIVPGLIFDKQGYRIGFGGGYFDRFLVSFPNKSLSIVSNIQLVDHIPTEEFDIPVQHLITETGIIK